MSAGAQAEARYEVSFSQEGKTKRMILPPEPPADDPAGCREWLTVVLALDSEHPIEGIEWYGQRGPNGYVVLKRRRAPEIAFEPAKHVNTPMRLIESVNWQKIPSDGPVPPFKAEHCRMLGHVIRCATDADGALDANQETEGIIGTFLDLAEQIEGLHTHGKSGQRYEAVSALQGEDDSGRAVGPPRYLLDADTGEIVIRVSDLLEVARRQVGSLPHGWLDARMGRLGWQRSQLQGYGLPGRDGRRHGPHARCAIYRGPLAAIRDEDAPDA